MNGEKIGFLYSKWRRTIEKNNEKSHVVLKLSNNMYTLQTPSPLNNAIYNMFIRELSTTLIDMTKITLEVGTAR